MSRVHCQDNITSEKRQWQQATCLKSYGTLTNIACKVVTPLLTLRVINFHNVGFVGVVSNVVGARAGDVDLVFVWGFILKVVVERPVGGDVQSPVVVARPVVLERVKDDACFVLNRLGRVPAGARLPVNRDGLDRRRRFCRDSETLIICNSIERTGATFGFFDSDFENVAVRAYCLCPGNRIVIDGGHVSSEILVSEEG